MYLQQKHKQVSHNSIFQGLKNSTFIDAIVYILRRILETQLDTMISKYNVHNIQHTS